MKNIIALLAIVLSFSATASAEWNFGFSLGYSPNYMVNLTGPGTVSGTFSFTTFNLNYDSTVEFGIDAWNTPKNEWGFISGFQYGGERNLKSGTYNGASIQTSSNVSKYQTHFLYAGTAHRWESFYIPLALTYGITKFTPATPMDVQIKNGVGVLLGIGWIIGDHFIIEYIGRAVTTELSARSGLDSQKTTGTISSAVLNFKYLF